MINRKQRGIPWPIALVIVLLVLPFGGFIGREIVLALGGPAAAQEIERMKEVRDAARKNAGNQ